MRKLLSRMPVKMKEFIAEKQRNKGRSVISSAYHDKENVTGVMIFFIYVNFNFSPTMLNN